MSRHRKKQRKSFAWPILVFGGILLIAAGFLFANKTRGSKVASVTQDEGEQPRSLSTSRKSTTAT